jgi:hypothetical protein
MLIQYLLDSTYIVLEYTNTVIHTKGKKQCNGLVGSTLSKHHPQFFMKISSHWKQGEALSST